MKLDTSSPGLKSAVKRAIEIAITLPLLLFVMLYSSLGEETERCGEGRSNIIEYRGVEHCVSDFWAFVDALTLPWLALVLALVLIGNLMPRLKLRLNDKGR